MHDDGAQVEARLGRAMTQWLRPAKYAASVPLEIRAWHVPGEPVGVDRALAATYEPFRVGDAWGPPWSTTWFRLRGAVPDGWAGQRVEAVIDLGFSGDGPGFQAEGLAYDAAGVPIKGIAPLNAYVPVARPAAGGETVDLLLEAAANPTVLRDFRPTDLGDRLTAGSEPLYRFARADIALLDEEVWHLLLDIEVLDGLMHELPGSEPRRWEILRALERMLDTLDLHDVAATATAARAELAEALARPAHASAHRLSAVGHAHIDSAWLWPLRETVRKAARTFANVTALAEDYPELVFACSQAQQYAWVAETQPHVFHRIREAVKAGTWAPVGSMWVESDANLPGGEALARQLVHGKRFFHDTFGVETQEIWLPDSFGYTAAFPQLAKLAGVRWFLTQKLSWNQTNRMPHSTFWWEGIDGTQIFTHFPPVDTYNAVFAASELSRAVRQYAEKGAGTRSLIPFGHGDGGGGPTREMLEKARRLHDLEGSPRVAIEPPDGFFAAAEAEYPDAPVWRGELYLELHRATYTTQAKTKAGNRRSEHLLREAELVSTIAALSALSSFPASAADDADDSAYLYPYEELDRLWKTVLLHQFHDILPGSSIAWVHREARATYERVRVELEELIGRAVAALDARTPDTRTPDTRTSETRTSETRTPDTSTSNAQHPAGRGVRVLNAAPYLRHEVAVFGAEQAAAAGPLADGGSAQRLSGGGLAVVCEVPALGVGGPCAVAVDPIRVEPADGGFVLDNGLLRVVVDRDGLLGSVRDLIARREVLAPGERGNLLQLHPDHPNYWDAWDIDRHYRHRHTDLVEADEVAAVETGPLLAEVRVIRSFGASRITQTLRLAAGARRLDVETEVRWRESEKVLKAAFPLDVHADDSAAEIQFGHVRRPTHTNTSWEHARFEIYAHRWLHVGETGYGVAVLNDATYGHDVTRGTRPDGGTTTTVRLTLLRAPHSPDPHTDQDVHSFTYALRPGAAIADAVAEGYAVNLPLRPVPASTRGRPPVVVDNPAVVVEAVKLADDRSGDVIIRLYESLGSRAAATLRTGFPLAAVAETDLLERPLGDTTAVRRDGDAVAFEMRPFQIRTLRLTLIK